MNNNVIAFPARRKPGRPRLRAIPNTPTAGILAFPDQTKSSNDMAADFDRLLDLVAFHLLMAGRAIAAHNNEREKG